MISVDVPKNLDEVETKAVGVFTKRQAIFYGVGAVMGIACYFLLKGILGMQATALLAMACAFPAFFMAQYKKNGFTGEQILMQVIEKKVIKKEIRPYQSENIYFDLLKDDRLRREKADIERKLYGKAKGEEVSGRKEKKGGTAKKQQKD